MLESLLDVTTSRLLSWFGQKKFYILQAVKDEGRRHHRPARSKFGDSQRCGVLQALRKYINPLLTSSDERIKNTSFPQPSRPNSSTISVKEVSVTDHDLDEGRTHLRYIIQVVYFLPSYNKFCSLKRSNPQNKGPLRPQEVPQRHSCTLNVYHRRRLEQG